MNYPYDYDERPPYQLVREWMGSFQREMDKEFNQQDIELTRALINEEYNEVEDELYQDDFDPRYSYTNCPEEYSKERLTKELCDLIWVCYFCAAKFGLPIEEAFKRVYESNMSKLQDDGTPLLNEMGKILKGPNYKPAQLGDLFDT